MEHVEAAVVWEPEHLELTEVALDPPNADEVLVDVKATGVCHSDHHRYSGRVPGAYPIVLGHEGAGVVEAVGDDVTTVSPGDHVVLSVVVSCGVCRFCSRGQPYLCEPGADAAFGGTMLDGTRRLHAGDQELNHFFAQSSFATKAVVPERCAIPVPEDVPHDQAALVGCGATTGLGAIFNVAAVSGGESVAIFGCGGLGASAVMAADAASAWPVVAVDVADDALARATGLGATHTVNSTETDPIAEIRDLTDGGVDYAFEFVGNPDVMTQAFDAVRAGGSAVVAGRARDGAEVSIDAPSFLRGKQIVGNVAGGVHPRVDIPRFVEMHRAGRIDLGALVSRQYDLAELETAFEDMERHDVIRGVVTQ